MWNEKVVPPSFVTANFRMLYKNKGSREDPKRYRCIALLNHAYKVLSIIFLGRMVGISDNFLKDWQAGFREARGCRDNTMILCVLCEKMMALRKSLAVVFVDYSIAFDSVSHKFVDTTLKEAGVSVKVRHLHSRQLKLKGWMANR